MTEIPRFASEDEERDFWATHDSVDFLEGAEQVNLEYVEREREFILRPSAESESFHTGSIKASLEEGKWEDMVEVGAYGAVPGATPGMESRLYRTWNGILVSRPSPRYTLNQ